MITKFNTGVTVVSYELGKAQHKIGVDRQYLCYEVRFNEKEKSLPVGHPLIECLLLCRHPEHLRLLYEVLPLIAVYEDPRGSNGQGDRHPGLSTPRPLANWLPHWCL